MSLIKSKPSIFGESVNITYWKICQFNYDVVDDRVVAIVCGYLNEQAKNEKSAPIDQATRVWNVSELSDTSIDSFTVLQIKARLYQKLKEPIIVNDVDVNFFTDAQDV